MQQQQKQHKVGGATASLLLLDVPDVWLVQLLSGQYLDSDSELSLFQACKKLNEMVMQNNKSTSLRIDPVARPRNRVLNMLQTANRHAPSIKLCLHHNKKCDNDTSWEDQQATAKQVMQTICSILEEAAQQGATTAITELQLENNNLEIVMPPAIGQACPNLTKLSLHACNIGHDKTISFKQQFQNLRALELTNCDCDAAATYHHHQADCVASTNTQALAALSSLTIVFRWAEFEGEANIINSLAAPLTHLCFDTTGIDQDLTSVDYDLKGIDWVQLGPTLQHLQLHGLYVGDDAMEIFLKMPCLTHVLVDHFNLRESYTGRPCKWEELVVEGQVDMKTLAYLPLHSGMLLKLGDHGSACTFNMETESSNLSPQALTNVKRAKAVEWVARHASLSQYEMEASKLAECISQALPLIKDVKNLEIESGDLNGAAMRALCEFVRGREDEPIVELDSDTHWLLKDITTLVQHMPCNGTLGVWVEGSVAEQMIIQLCCGAQNKLSVRALCRGKKLLCEQRIRSALQAHDIEVISLAFTCCCTLSVTVQPRHYSLS